MVYTVIILFVIFVTLLTLVAYYEKHSVDNKFMRLIKKGVTNKYSLIFLNLGFGVAFLLIGLLSLISIFFVWNLDSPLSSFLFTMLFFTLSMIFSYVGIYRLIYFSKKYFIKKDFNVGTKD